VVCVERAAKSFMRSGLITGQEKGLIVSEAAQSQCGY
jgi:hypothetical protein